eukprot:CAMPEP_0117605114 /NCGR_PEP_ID=MMETSP0784-20121206/79029_1 /TAXON_ID=39447 /ORGANISM="" /LENGTH=634 /DNA_ID=CAMNT_0005408153 /DNA_START=100 /DNA_END=2002 /DNA_ORIENTATION=+
MVKEGAAAGDLVARVKRWREVQSLQHESIPNVAETLEKVRTFLQEHETPSVNDCTHTVFDNYDDWWVAPKSSHKLAIAEDNTLELLHKCITELYLLGIPLTLAQDLCIWGSAEEAVNADDLLSPGGGFAEVLGQALGEIFPQSEFLDLVIFDATGHSRTKGLMKTSVRLVWSGLVVDRDRALRIHDFVVHKFKDSLDEKITSLFRRMQEFNKDNVWSTVFSDEVYNGRHPVRMPLCDRVSPSPMKGPEHRPFVPLGVTRFSFQEGVLQDTKRIVGKDDLEGWEWLKIGTLRCDAGTQLTDWTQPTWKGERMARASCTTTSVAAAVAAGGRSSGQVKLRTRNGSDGPRQPRAGQQIRDEQIKTAERLFDGTIAEFREKLEAQLGKQDENFTEDDKTLTWKQAGESGATLVFKAANRRVYITGKMHQVRSLLSVIQSFARSVGESARSGTQTARSRGGATSQAGQSSYAPSLAPSAVYAPSLAPSQAFSTISSRATEARSNAPSHRIVIRPFQPESASELKLNEGDQVTITHEPGDGANNVHRWVYGKNETTGSVGWFPFSHSAEDTSRPQEESATTIEILAAWLEDDVGRRGAPFNIRCRMQTLRIDLTTQRWISSWPSPRLRILTLARRVKTAR